MFSFLLPLIIIIIIIITTTVIYNNSFYSIFFKYILYIMTISLSQLLIYIKIYCQLH